MHAEIPIREIFHPELLSCTLDTTLQDAARQMVEARHSSVLVMKEGEVLGIWTEQDALKMAAADPEAHQQPISSVMSHPVRTIHVDCTIGDATVLFREQGVRHFLVIDGSGQPLGMLSQSDIVRNQGLEYYVSLREVKSVFNRDHLTVSADMPLHAALQQMHDGHFSSIVIHFPDGEHGIVTERDAVRYLSATERKLLIGELATRPLLTIPLHSSLYYAKKQFVSRKIRHLGVTGENGELLGVMSFADILANIEHDYITHLREALREREESLAISNQHLKLASKAFESTFEGIMITNAHNVIESVNPAFTQITGYMPHEVVGQTPRILASGRHDETFYRTMFAHLHQEGHWQGEIWNRRKNGDPFIGWLNINAVRDDSGQVSHYVAIFSDITNRKAAEEKMHFLAHHDALTGLPNRSMLHVRFQDLSRAHAKLAIMFLDLDYFKQINDTLGHYAGDQLIRIVAQRLSHLLGPLATVARLGGDEFVILYPYTDPADVTTTGQRIIDSIAQPMILENREAHTSASIGISLYPAHAHDLDDLIRYADRAMYLSKESGRGRYHVYECGLPTPAEISTLAPPTPSPSSAWVSRSSPVIDTHTALGD